MAWRIAGTWRTIGPMNGLAWLIVGAAIGVGGTLGVQYASKRYRVTRLSGAGGREEYRLSGRRKARRA